MKKIINRILILTLAVSFMSCSDLLDINTDPNAASSANIDEVFTTAEANVAYITSRYFNDARASLWSQYTAWGPGVALGPLDKFEFVATGSNGMWSRSYASCLQDFDFVIKSGEPVYSGISKLLSAYLQGLLVDHFDDIPYSEANQGLDGNLNPAYDDAATIYAALVAKVDEAIAEIEGAPLNAEIPSTNDIIYGGDLDAWVKFGNSLKLKLLMRQSETGGPADLASQVAATVANGNFIETSAENAEFAWEGASGSENPLYALFESGLGNFYILSQTTLDALDDLNDPRLGALYDLPASGASTVHIGVVNGDQPTGSRNDYSEQSALVYGPGLPTVLMSATEVWFYRAEAGDIARGYSAESSETAFNNAVTSSFTDLGLASDAPAYLTSLNYASASDKIAVIADQMWIAFNGTQTAEGWITTRKFDNASRPLFASSGGKFVSPLTNSLGVGVYPSILLYPQTEINLNPNVPAQHALTDKVFWDN